MNPSSASAGSLPCWPGWPAPWWHSAPHPRSPCTSPHLGPGPGSLPRPWAQRRRRSRSTVVVGGMPGWQITLIAVVAALFAATVAVLADRARSARRKAIAATA